MFVKKVIPVYYLLFRKSMDGEVFFTHALDTYANYFIPCDGQLRGPPGQED
jgi:hypothetical protein